MTERKTERWTSKQIYILIKKRDKIIKLVHNHIMISFSVSIQELDRFIVLERGALPAKIDRKVLFNGCRTVFVFNCGELSICDLLDTTQTSDYCVCMFKKAFCRLPCFDYSEIAVADGSLLD